MSSDISSDVVETAGGPCRVMRKGSGPKIGYLGGIGGVPTWLPFLDDLAADHTVIVPSLPGFPGSSGGFRNLDSHLDWLTATLDLLELADLGGADLIASSVSAMLAADVAAFSPGTIGNLILVGPWGLYDTELPGRDYFASLAEERPGLLVENTEKWTSAVQMPTGTDEIEWEIEMKRAAEAAARVSWPFGDRGSRKRLHRVRNRTLVLWGENDRILPPEYADKWVQGLTGPVQSAVVAGSGHDCVMDQPAETAKRIRRFLAQQPNHSTVESVASVG
jgi:pimeloyl-ACP methyl ester carboxylesterase